MTLSRFVFMALFFTLIAKGEELYIGSMTELKFDPKKISSLPFEPCPAEESSSCATLEKILDNTPFFKSKIVCTFKVKGENVSKLEISEPRILKVKEVERNSSDEVTTLVLEGAKAPIHFSCAAENSQGTNVSRMFDLPLRIDVLKNFKEFELVTVGYDVPPSRKMKPQPKPQSERKPPGKAI